MNTGNDFSELAAMLDWVMTNGMTVANLNAGTKSVLPLNRTVIAENDDAVIVGWSVMRRSENEPKTRAFTSLIVHPDFRHKGIGSALIDDVTAHAKSIGITELKSRAKDSELAWLAWAESKGFKVDRQQFRSSV